MQSKTIKKWQALFKLRREFTGTTQAFCLQHNISASCYYQRLNQFSEFSDLQKKKAKPTKPVKAFIKVEPVKVEPVAPAFTVPSSEPIKFNARTGELSLPSTLAVQDVIRIIKGLMP